MMTPHQLPGDGFPWPLAARTWLKAVSCPDEDLDDVIESALPFAPATLKQVLTGVMDLGRRAGRLGETMALLGHQEAEFRRLREAIGIPRAAPPSNLVPVAVLVRTSAGWVAPGGWVPDILDRAAGRDVLNESGARTRSVRLEQLGVAGPDHIFILDPISQQTDGTKAQHVEIVNASGLNPDHVHVISPSDSWLSPVPELPHAIFDAASRLHGFSAVFSDLE